MPKLYGPHLTAFSVAGVELERGADGSFEVPEEHVADAKSHGLRDTPEEPAAPAPAEDPVVAALRDMTASRDVTLQKVRELELAAAEREKHAQELEAHVAELTKPGKKK